MSHLKRVAILTSASPASYRELMPLVLEFVGKIEEAAAALRPSNASTGILTDIYIDM